MRRPELIVFDWDGTLMDSARRIVGAVQGAIATAGLAPRTEEQVREVIGLGMDEAVAALYPDTAADARARLAATYREAFATSVAAEPAALFPGAERVLEELESAGYLLAIATGKSRGGLHRDLAHAGIAQRFVASRTVDECASKPDPEMLHALLREFSLHPGAAVMIGDTEFDLEMARRAGVPGVGVSWGVHPPERLRQAGPAHLIDDLDELLPWLGRIHGGHS